METQLGDATGSSKYSQFYGEPYYNTYMASYRSDGLRVYARVDMPPTEMPADGYPVIIFTHGWIGADDALKYGFNYAEQAHYGDQLDTWVKAGYVVLMPGFRGHGTVKGVPAEGLEYIQAYDNGSYLSPMFYAIDILNFLEGVGTLNEVAWQKWGLASAKDVRVDSKRIYLTGHSQGGDAALTALVVSSSPNLKNTFAAASIWNGCLEGRIEQGAFYGPQETSSEAVKDASYFPMMPSSWDKTRYSGSIADGIAKKKSQMYETIKTYIVDQANADPATNSLVSIMATLDAHKYPQYIKAPLDLHYSNMDYYSIPAWNESLVRMVRATGGTARAYLYPGNTHELQVDANAPAGSVAGRPIAIERTIQLFNTTCARR